MGNAAGGFMEMMGTLGAAEMQADAQEDVNSKNIEFAAQSREMERENYRSRYQWTVEDLRKAGLNPILAALNSASSVGSMAANANQQNPYAGLADAVSNSAGRASELMSRLPEKRLASEQVRTEKTQQDLNRANAQKAEAEKVNTVARLPELIQNSAQAKARAGSFSSGFIQKFFLTPLRETVRAIRGLEQGQ